MSVFESEIDPNIQQEINHIRSLSQVQLAELWRYAPPGHPYFKDGPLYMAFRECFQGMTPEISKLIER